MDNAPIISVLRAAITDARTVFEQEQTLLEAGGMFATCIEHATGIKVDVCLLRLLDEDAQPMHNSRLMFHGSAVDIDKVYTFLKESNVCPATMPKMPLSSCVTFDTVKGKNYVVVLSSPMLIRECASEFMHRLANGLPDEKAAGVSVAPQHVLAVA